MKDRVAVKHSMIRIVYRFLAFDIDRPMLPVIVRARQRTGELGVGAIRPDLVKPSVIGRAGGFQFIGEG